MNEILDSLHVQGKKLRTPALNGTILPGVTRQSVLDLAKSLGLEVSEESIPVEEALQADEIFTTGTLLTNIVNRIVKLQCDSLVELNPGVFYSAGQAWLALVCALFESELTSNFPH
jgi:hypothetical protein